MRLLAEVGGGAPGGLDEGLGGAGTGAAGAGNVRGADLGAGGRAGARGGGALLVQAVGRVDGDDLADAREGDIGVILVCPEQLVLELPGILERGSVGGFGRSEEHTSELQSQSNLVCR